jgi:hypothetical protein
VWQRLLSLYKFLRQAQRGHGLATAFHFVHQGGQQAAVKPAGLLNKISTPRWELAQVSRGNVIKNRQLAHGLPDKRQVHQLKHTGLRK